MHGTIPAMRRIFLIGLSGSGKSTVGRLLAQRLQIPLYDVDALVEERSNSRIPTLFSTYGEAYFRDCESHALADAIAAAPCAVIATGGGIVLREENRALMAQHGIRVLLAVDAATSLARLQAQQREAQAQGVSPEVRPLLAGPDPLQTLQTLLETRTYFYEEAEYTCSTVDTLPESIVREIVTMLQAEETGQVAPIQRHIRVGEGYDTIVEWHGLGRLAEYLHQLSLPPRLFLCTDSNVERIYAPAMMEQLTLAGFEPYLYTIPSGEGSKSQQQLFALYDWLVEHRVERKEAIIALGGGVVGDLVGFVAATYLRGVPLIHIPTSLLALVDSAIGGKTGINHPRGKNLIGAFYHPRLVLVDPSLLLTLPERERTEGWAEVVKYGIILDAELFAQLEANAGTLRAFTNPPISLVCTIIARCIELKAVVIEGDEREQGRRAILNYGHTIGHALEQVTGYGTLLHGEAVSLGMVVAAELAHRVGLFPAEEVCRQNDVLRALGLPVSYTGREPVSVDDLLAATLRDKKVDQKQVHWILPRHIGEVTRMTVPESRVREVVSAFLRGELQ